MNAFERQRKKLLEQLTDEGERHIFKNLRQHEIEDFETIFKIFDTTDDGAIEEKEITAVFSSLGY